MGTSKKYAVTLLVGMLTCVIESYYIVSSELSGTLAEKGQLEWINCQNEIIDELSDLEIPVNKFNWSFNPSSSTDRYGRRDKASRKFYYLRTSATENCANAVRMHRSDIKLACAL